MASLWILRARCDLRWCFTGDGRPNESQKGLGNLKQRHKETPEKGFLGGERISNRDEVSKFPTQGFRP